MNRICRLGLLAAVVAAPLAARPARAQDIVEQAKRARVPVPEGYLLAKKKDRNAFEFKRAWKSALRTAKAKRAAMARSSGMSATSASGAAALQRAGAVTGTFRVPVIPMLFSNTTAAPYIYSNLQGRLFGAGSVGSETVTHVYNEMSRGQLTLTGDVHNWVRAPNADTYYEGSTNGLGSSTEASRIFPLFKAVLDSADKDTDFGQYDRDNDGYVDFVAFVQPEFGGECGGGSKNLWSHRYYLEGLPGGYAYKTNDVNAKGDTVKISDYVLQPALNCTQLGGGMIDIGVFAHEFGHAFGLPDLYATGASNNQAPTNEGIGEWGLMSSGNWNIPSSPAHMEAWSKMQLGWVPVITVAHDTTITLAPDEDVGGNIIRMNIPGTSEYFLLENRQRVGSDQALFGTGLLIFHVDSVTVENGWAGNYMQDNAAHKGLDVVEADGLNGLDTPGYRGGPGDIFPGSSNATSFTPNTSPNTNSYNNNGVTTASGITITNIVQNGQNVTFTVSFGSFGPIAMKWGDVNGDGVITQADYAAVYNCLVGAACSSSLNVGRGDVDGDGRLTATDALIIHSYVQGGVDVSRYRVGQQTTTPVPPIAVSGSSGSPGDGTWVPSVSRP